MPLPRQQQSSPTTTRTKVPYRVQQSAPHTGTARPGERVIIVQLPADHPLADRSEPPAAHIAAIRAAVGRDALFFVLLLAGVMLAAASLTGLRWAANTPTPTPTTPVTAITGQ